MDPQVARSFNAEAAKLASRFRVSADLARKAGLEGAGDKIEEGGRAAAYRIYKTLNYKIPGTGTSRLPFMTPSRRRKLTMALADNPHLLPLAAAPIPGTVSTGLGLTAAGNAAMGHLGLGT